MSATNYNTIIDQGADWFITFTYQNSSGTPINITGYTAALQLRSEPSDATAVLSLSSPSNGITITGATGTVAVTATAAQTGAISPGYYYYDLEITSGSAVVTRLAQGQIEVNPQVTR
jgi:NADH:ubiquinone oxidoreductase subunit F (NADH-binding)